MQTNAKDLYLKPELTIHELPADDIIITSNVGDNETDDNWGDGWL